MPVRRLQLRAERLSDLVDADLRHVAGAVGPTHQVSCVERCPAPTSPVLACLSLDARTCTDTCTL